MSYSPRGLERLGQLLDDIAIRLVSPPESLPLPHTTLDRAVQRAESIARRLFLLPQIPDNMATVTTTIGTSSRDYSTISSWEADLDNSGIYSAADDAVGECYNDSVFNEDVSIDGGGIVGINSATVTVASGERHDGTAGSGARIVDTASASPYSTFELDVDGVDKTVEWLEITRTSSLSLALIQASTLSATTTLRVKNCILHDISASTSGGPSAVTLPNVGSAVWEVCNNVIYDITHATSNANDVCGIKFSGVGAGTCLANNTVHNIVKSAGTGDAFCYAVSDDADLTIRNNIGTDPTNGGSGAAGAFSPSSFASATCSNNLSSDATASGTGSLTSKSATNQFVSIVGGSEDLHLKTGADAIDAGADLGTTANIDIDGRDRDAEGDTWDIGADEFVAAGGGTSTATAGLVLAAAIAAGSASFTGPGPFSASASLSSPPPVADAVGATSVPNRTATAELVAASAVGSGIGAVENPTFAASAALQSPSPSADGTASFGSAVFSATAAVSVPSAVADAVASFSPPQFGADGSLSVAAPVVVASGSFANSLFQGAATLLTASPAIDAVATVSNPSYTGSATLLVAAPVVDASSTDFTVSDFYYQFLLATGS